MVAMRELEAIAADRVKSRFVFAVTSDSRQKPSLRRFRDPLGPEICTGLVDALRKEGFSVREPKPGRACDAGFDVILPDFSVIAVLQVERDAGFIQCGLLTWCQKPLWRRVSLQAASDAWARVCAAIERALRQHPDLSSLLWLTSNEDERRLEKVAHGR